MSGVESVGGNRGTSAIALLSSIVTIWMIGMIVMLLAYSISIMIVYDSNGVPPQALIARSDIVKTVILEGLHSSLGQITSAIPWPSGVTIARIQGRLPQYEPLFFHLGINAVIFAILGWVAGRVDLRNSFLLIPALLFFQTFGFLKGEFFRLQPLNLIPISIVFLMQVVAMYCFSIWGKWSLQR